MEGRVAPSGGWSVFRVEDADCGLQVVDIDRDGADVRLQLVSVSDQLIALGDKAGKGIGTVCRNMRSSRNEYSGFCLLLGDFIVYNAAMMK